MYLVIYVNRVIDFVLNKKNNDMKNWILLYKFYININMYSVIVV